MSSVPWLLIIIILEKDLTKAKAKIGKYYKDSFYTKKNKKHFPKW